MIGSNEHQGELQTEIRNMDAATVTVQIDELEEGWVWAHSDDLPCLMLCAPTVEEMEKRIPSAIRSASPGASVHIRRNVGLPLMRAVG